MPNRAVTLLAILALLVFAIFGLSMRWMSDDYCYAAAAAEGGITGAIGVYYEQWFGRLTQAGGVALATMLGTWFAAVFPALLILIWALSLYWLIYELASWFGLARPRQIAWILAPVLLLCILAGIPQIFQSLYWLSGVFPYTVPLVMLTLMLAWIVRNLRPQASALAEGLTVETGGSIRQLPLVVIAGTSVMALIAALASESYAVIQAGLIGWSWLALLLNRRIRRPLILPIISWSVVTGIAFFILLSSPGNTYRSGFFSPTTDPLTLLSRSLESTAALIIASLIYFAPVTLVGAIAATHLAARHTERPRITRSAPFILLILAVGFTLLLALNVPAIYATSLPPPARVYSISQFVLVGVFAALGFVIGLRARRTSPVLNILTIAILVILPLMASVRLLGYADPVMRFARDWDAQSATIQAQIDSGVRDVIAPPLSIDLAATSGLDTLTASPGWWLNDCAARYYGVESFTISS